MKKEYVGGFKHLPEHMVDIAYHSAWSIQNMEAHEIQDQTTTYIGSVERKNGYITDYFQDNNGDWWFDDRYRKSTGEIITMEEHIFGHTLPERRYGT